MQDKRKRFIAILSFILIMITTFAYSALATNLAITGEAKFRAVADIRVSNINQSEAIGTTQSFDPEFTKDTITAGFELTSTTSKMSYDVTITNSGEIDQAIYNLITQSSNNSGLSILIDGQPINQALPIIVPFGTSKTVTISYQTTTPGTVNVVNKFDFRKVYYITYNLQGGTSNSSDLTNGQIKYENVDLTITNDEPKKNGYKFIGWNEKQDGTGTNYNKPNNMTYTQNSDKILYAMYEVDIATITLNSDSETGTTKIYQKYNDGLYLTNTNGTLSNKMTTTSNGITPPQKDGYKFEGYYTEANGQGTKFIESNGKLSTTASTTQFTEDGNLYAYYTPYKMTINYYAGGATKNGNVTLQNQKLTTDTYDYDGEDLNVNGLKNYDSQTGTWNLIKEGYHADKYWHLGNNASTTKVHEDTKIAKIQDLATTLNKIDDFKTGDIEVNIYAGWTANTYKLHFDKNNTNATGVMSDQTLTYDAAEANRKINKNIFTFAGHTFVGWNTQSNGQGTPYTDEQVVNIVTQNNQTVDLYAQWIANTYTVTYNANGGTVSTPSKQVTYGSTYGTLPEPSKLGYTFNGWFTDNTYTTEVTSSTQVTITDNQTIIAKWTANSYTVTANANGGSISSTTGWTGTGNTSTKSVTYDSTYGTLPTVSRTGYTLKGWSLLPNGYKQVEYIESTGTQYIDTGYKPTPNTSIESEFEFTSTTQQQRLFGVSADPAVSDTLSYDFYISSGNVYSWAYKDNSGNWSWSTITADLNRHYLYFDGYNKKITIDSYNSAMISTTSNSSSVNLPIFARYSLNTSSITQNASVKLYLFKMYEENELVRDFIPCVNESTGKAGLYDLVEGKFYGNAATSGNDFTVPEEEYFVDSTSIVNIPSNHNIYANWTPKQLTVVFNKNDGSSTTSSTTYTYDGNMNDDRFTPATGMNSRTGYTFAGWSFKEDGSDGIHYPYTDVVGENWFINQVGTSQSKTINLYAQWTLNKYYLTYQGNGATNLVNSNLVAKYDAMYHDSNTLLDISGNNKNGTASNVAFGTDYMQFNGSSSWVNLGIMNSNYRSMEVTFETDVLGGCIFGNWETGGGGLFINSDGTLTAEFYISGYKKVTTTTKLEVGKKYHAATTYDGTTFIIYLNGNLEASLPVSGTIGPAQSSTVMSIGSNPAGSNIGLSPFKGKIYNAAVYNAALSADQIASDAGKEVTYDSTYGTLPTPQRAGYTFGGWYKEAALTNAVTSTTKVSTASDHSLYAKWSANALTFVNKTLNAGTYGTAYTSNAFDQASNGTGSYTYTIKSGAPTGATIDSTNRKISFPSTTAAGTYNVVVTAIDNNSGVTKDATMTIVINRANVAFPTCSAKTYNKAEQTLFDAHTSGSYTNSVLKATNAGTYTVALTPSANHKWTDNGGTTARNLSCTINKYNISSATVSAIADHTYNNTVYKPTPSVTVPLPNSTTTYTLTDSEYDYSYSVASPKDVATYTVTMTAKADTSTFTNNYTGSVSKTYKIVQANGYVNLSATTGSVTYGTASKTFTVSSSHGGDLTVSDDNTTATSSISNGTVTIGSLGSLASGTKVKVTVTSAATTNYKAASATYELTITNASINCGTVAITGNNVVGEKLTATTTSTPSDVTKTYQWYTNTSDSVTGGTAISGATSSEFTLTSSQVGKYIYATITCSKTNYTTASSSGKATTTSNKTATTRIKVNKPDATGTNGYCINPTYNGSAQVLTNQSKDHTGYAFSNNSATNYNASGYNVVASLSTNYIWSDYTTANTTINCNITRRAVTYKADSDSKTYNGTALTKQSATLTSGTLVSGHTATFSITGTQTNAGSSTNTLNSVTIKNGTTDVTANYNITKQNGTLTVNKADASCTISASPTLTYPGATTGNITYSCTGDGALSVTSSDTSVITVGTVGTTSTPLTAKKIGSSTISVSRAAGTNYNAATAKTSTINVTGTVYSITLNNQSATSAGTTKAYYSYNTTKTVNGTLCYYYTDSALTTCLSSGYNITKPTKTGYTFGGYYTSTGGSGTQYVNDGGSFVNNIYQKYPAQINSSYTNDITLYAKWTINKYYLTYDYQDSYSYSGAKALDTGYKYDWSKNFKIESKFKIPELGKRYAIFGNFDNGANNLNFEVNTSNKLRIYMGNGTLDNSSTDAIPANTEITATYTWNASTKKYTLTATGTNVNISMTGTMSSMSGTATANVLVGRDQRTNVFNPITISMFKISTEYDYNTSISTLPTPTKTGYTYSGWYDAATGGNKVTSVTMPASNKTIYAQSTANTYTVTYNTNKPSEAPTNVTGTTANSSHTYDVSKALTTNGYSLTGYDFAGWNTKADGTGTAYLDKASVTNLATSGTVTLYAQWMIKNYYLDLNYNLDGQGQNIDGTATGSGPYSWSVKINGGTATTGSGDYWKQQNYNSTYEVTITPNAGYTASQTKWTGTIGAGNVSITIPLTTTIYTIGYTLNGGSVATANPTSYNVRTANITLNNPTRIGYTFAGWTGSNGTTAQTSVTIAKGTTGNKTYTANWTKNNYTLTFDANGGSVGTTTKSVTYGTTYTDLPTPTRAGYTFKGWYTDLTTSTSDFVNYGREYMYTDKLSIHLSAYSSNWGSSWGNIISSTEGGGFNIESNNSTGSGYIQFANYDAGYGYKVATSSVQWSNLSAGWHDFDLVFDGNYTYGYLDGTKIATSAKYASGKIGYNGSNSIFVGAEASSSPTAPTTPNFNGYIGNIIIKNDSNLIAGTTYNTITAPAQNVTLKAKWVPTSYSITYDLQSGTNASGNPSSYTIESNAITLANPTRSGYTFNGWTGSNNLYVNSTNYTTSSPYTAAARDHYFGNDITITSGKTYRVFVTAKRTAGTLDMQGGLWYTAQTSGAGYDGYTGAFTLYQSLNDGWGIYYKDVTVPTGKTKGKFYIQLNQTSGSYTTSWSLANMGVYELGTAPTIPKGSTGNKSFTANWSKAMSALTITLGTSSYTYDKTAKTPTVTVKDGSTTLTKDTDYTVSYSSNTNAGTATVTITTKGAYNSTTKATYTGSTSKTFTINKKALTTSTGTCSNKTYDGNTTATCNSYSATGVISGDTVTVGKTCTFNNKNVGTGKTVTCAGSLSGTSAANYSAANATTTANITAKALTITADNKSMTYGASAPTYSYSVSGAVSGESPVSGTATYTIKSGSTTVSNVSTANAGSYTIVPSGLTINSNYSASYSNGTLTINKANASSTVLISGTNTWGQTLSTAYGIPSDDNGTISYQWYYNNSNSTSGGTAISGATSSSYTIDKSLVGKYIYVKLSVGEGTNYKAAADSYDITSTTVAKQSCGAPSNVTIGTNRTVSWAAGNGASSYKVCAATNTSCTPSTALTSGSAYAAVTDATGSRRVYVQSQCNTSYYSSATSSSAYGSADVVALTIGRNNTSYGTVSTPSYNVVRNATYTTSSNVLTLNDGRTVTATATAASGYQTSFSSWSPTSGTISAATTVTANFSRSANTYTLTLNRNFEKVSHTSNIDDTGKKNSNYGNSWTNANITGTDRGDTSKAHVVTISGATSLTVDVYYNGESKNYDWVSIWSGSHPTFTAASNYNDSSAVAQKLGGSQSGSYTVNGNSLTGMGYSTYTVSGDTVTFGFKSDGSGIGAGYGYYAIVRGNETKSVTYNGTYGTLSTPTRTGYAFAGWYTAATGGTRKQASDIYNTAGNSTLYAHWTANSYSIAFNKNNTNATGTMSNLSMTYDVAKNLTANSFYYAEHVFAGWNTKADGTGTAYLDGASVKNLAASGTVTLYAQWVIANATFLPGSTINARMKAFAGNTSTGVWDAETTITQFKKSSTKPTGTNATGEHIVSTLDSNTPIYMWYDNGIMYWWSEDSTPALNPISTDMFINLRALQTIPEFSSFDGTNVTEMIHMFFECNALTSLQLSTTFANNNNKITNIAGLFYNCNNLTSLDLHNIKTANVIEMAQVFANCKKLSTLNITGWDTSKVTTMRIMFENCEKLTSLNLSSWNTSKVTDMEAMFSNDGSLTQLDLSGWNTSSVTNMKGMFRFCSKLKTIYASENFVTTNVTNSSDMFNGCNVLVGGQGTTFSSSYIDKTRALLDEVPSNPGYFTAKDATFVYGGAFNSKFKKLAGNTSTGVWDAETTITQFKKSLTKPTAANMTSDHIVSDSNSPTPIYMWKDGTTMYWWSYDPTPYLNASSTDMFINLRALQTIPEFSSFDGTNVTEMIHMFFECNSLTSLQLSTTFANNNNKITNIAGLFYNCNNLTSLDLHNIKTANVIEMAQVFAYCKRLSSLNIIGWDTSKVTTMQSMFKNCENLTSLDLSSWNTSKVTNMEEMFSNDVSLNQLNLRGWNTSSVTNMGYMFRWCTHLVKIYVSSSFVTTNVTSSDNMFYDCGSLLGGQGTTFSSSYVDKTRAKIDGGTSSPGYFSQ